MNQWNYGMLNMSNVQPQRENNGLPVGRHKCRVAAAELVPTKAGTYQVVVDLQGVDVPGKTQDRITVFHPRAGSDANSAKSVEIGKERLMALLTYGGHPNPAAHRDVKELVGLIVGVVCDQDVDWVDDKGVTRKGGVKPQKNGAYFSLDELAGGAQSQAAPQSAPSGMGRGDLDDEIPF